MKFTTGIKSNLTTYFLLMLLTLLGLLYGKQLLTGSYMIRLWDYEDIGILLLGLPFLFLFAKAGLPDFWDEKITDRQRLLYPLLIGLVFGLLDVLIIKVIQHLEPYTELPPFLQPFPYSLFLYTSGAFEIEVFYRLIPLTLLLWIGKQAFEGRYFNYFMWVGMILTSIREPLEQFPSGEWWFVTYSLLTGFLMNFWQAKLFVNYGFMASLALRMGHYLVWHILLGAYVQWVELA